MIYDVDYFIDKFQKIGDEKIITHLLHDEKGGHCANGWCGVNHDFRSGSAFTKTPESVELRNLFSLLSCEENRDSPNFPYYSDIAAKINNGVDLRYKQNTAKQRILAALNDIKKMQSNKEEETKTKIKYVAVDADIRKEAEKVIENSVHS